METEIQLGSVVATLVFKDIKNVHLSVYPPLGHIRISAPLRMSVDSVRAYAVTKLPWIKKQQQKLQSQERETLREYTNRESHYLWGKRLLLKVHETDGRQIVVAHPRHLDLYVHTESSREQRAVLVEDFYRDQIKKVIPEYFIHWEQVLGVQIKGVFVQRMKTRWGSCNWRSRHVRLNTELAKKPIECLEYIIVHEMAHLIEPTHNANFIAILDSFLPKWRFHKEELNRLPVRHENWIY